MTIPLAIGFGTLIGLLLGLVGGGGSILTVPVLVYALGQGVHEATATSLVIVGATALVGTVHYVREDEVAMRTAAIFGAAGIGGVFVGTWFNARASGPLILLLFGGLMLIVAARMGMHRAPPVGRQAWQQERGFPFPVLVAGFVVGVMTGFFGVGGGFLIVPALVLVLGLPMRLAVGTSLVIIAINSGAGIVAHLPEGGVNVPLALLFVAGGVVGSTLGGKVAGSIDETKLSRGFAILVAVVGVYLIVGNLMAVA